MIMKQRLLLTAFVLLAAVAGRADELINEETFPDAIFRNWVLSQWFGKDGVLTHDEVLNITQINLTNKGIADLKGIEYFEALEDLYCPGNNLTSLNVSENTALIQLSCGNNQLTSLNVSKNTALEYLQCGNNQLNYLNVSMNTALKELDCYFNQLTELDLSKNKGLISLRIYNNQIKGKAMDALIASLPTVTNRDLHVIGYKGEQNDITFEQVKAVKAKGWNPLYYTNGTVQECTGSLSINETNFPDANFRKWLRLQDYGIDDVLTDLEIADITEINVTEKSIKDMKGIEFFTALEDLYCSDNNLTSLDVSKNTALLGWTAAVTS
jgi:Leucine-rich repeat (LRR) protein